MFYVKMNKSKNFTPGYIMVLHTFGRDLKWNPHIHCLISEDGYSDDGFWRHITHFNYTYLRNAFRTALLNEMQSRLGPSFKKVKALCYSEHKHGFYVYAKPDKCDPKTVVKYIGRYLGRPVIATSRIDKYDGEFVTFHYNRHEDEKYVEETLPVNRQPLICHARLCAGYFQFSTMPTAVFPIKNKKGTGFLQCLKLLLCTFQILLYLFSYVNQVLYVPSKPHTVCFKYHSPIYLTLTLLRIYESRISRKLRFLDTFAPQSYASSHPCPGPFCAPFHSFLSASAFLRVWISLRPISNSQLHTLLYFHLCPIYLVFFKGSWDISS